MATMTMMMTDIVPLAVLALPLKTFISRLP
jgi:hypothetical protein